jgi:hypothetical protein
VHEVQSKPSRKSALVYDEGSTSRPQREVKNIEHPIYMAAPNISYPFNRITLPTGE